MSFAGNLKTVSFGDVLQLISTGKKSGALNLDRSRRGKKIFFHEGEIISASSVPPTDEERLGQLLLRRGQMAPDQLERALKRQQASGKKLGQVLVELGILDRKSLAQVLSAQVEEIVYSIFGWPDGGFQFAEGEAPDNSQQLVRLNTLNVMMEGARRYDEYSQIAHALPEEDTVLRLSPVPTLPDGDILLSEGDLEILASIDGERSVGDILCGSSRGEYTASKALYKILSADLAEPCPDKADAIKRRDEEREIYDLIYKLYSHSLDTVHKALVEQIGEVGDRIFFRLPASCDKDPWDMIGALLETPGPDALDTFRKKTLKIPPPVRIHRVLACARQALSVAIRELADRVGPSIARDVAGGIEKDLSILLAQKRALADKYDVKREFAIAVKGMER